MRTFIVTLSLPDYENEETVESTFTEMLWGAFNEEAEVVSVEEEE